MIRFKVISSSLLALVFMAATLSTIELEVKSLLDNKIELKIPKGFEIMSEEMLKVKYPAEDRPTLVYTNEAGSVNVAVNLTVHPASQDLMEPYKENFVASFKNLYPSASWKGNGVTTIDDRKVGFLELTTPATDTEIYNLLFFTDVQDKLLLCTFNCTKEQLVEWQTSAKEIMNSLKLR